MFPTSKSLKSSSFELRTNAFDKFWPRRLDIVKRVVDSQLFPFVAPHLMKWQHIDPLNISQLEKNLRRINRAGDFQVKATLSPNPIPGKTDIRLDVQERQPLQVSLLYDDQGRQTIGTQRWGTEFTNRNVSGIGDRFTARWIGAAGTQAALASYFVPLNRFGTELGSTFSFSLPIAE